MTNLNKVINYIQKQFETPETQEEIKRLSNTGIDFFQRTQKAIDIIVPTIFNECKEIANTISKVYNYHINDNMALQQYESLKELELRSIAYAPCSDKVSSMIQTCLSKLKLFYINGANSYPDLFLTEADYSLLPKGVKVLSEEQVDSPYLSRYTNPSKFNPLRPNKVPDGLEIKCVQVKSPNEKFTALSHAPHTGLHLGCKWIFKNNKFEILDIYLGFFNRETYRTYQTKTEADTRKCFLEQKHFISLIHGD